MKRKSHCKDSLKGFEVSNTIHSTKFNSKNMIIAILIQPINFVKILQDNLKWILCFIIHQIFLLGRDWWNRDM